MTLGRSEKEEGRCDGRNPKEVLATDRLRELGKCTFVSRSGA